MKRELVIWTTPNQAIVSAELVEYLRVERTKVMID